ncbi:MAG: rhodanese-like domain-containing protein [Alicyclobacillus herbarius]|uniref:rhodanese-like domain-containing protein n=1 Tax=Alicyclobacillus herbarius TaxID=122960 RepID=UPI000411B5E8|nr:rhodanese-like domain-containing protein [Alicyclobacillus herbarius]MCL6631286.1 rhodanese-like domain-containing protein [Alicyclobacillus herbarius]
MATERNGVAQYSSDELKQILKEGTVQVIDVRTPEEYASGHIPGIPLRPMEAVAKWIEDLNPNESYVFVCRSGNRSQRVAEFLKANGFKRIGNFDGGMLAWDGDIKTGSNP